MEDTQDLEKKWDFELEVRPVSTVSPAITGDSGEDAQSKVEPLPAGEVGSLLERAPALLSDPKDQASFFQRESSLKPPRAGTIVQQPFPLSSEAKPQVPIDLAQVQADAIKKAGPLKIVRSGPAGEVKDLNSIVTVTFSHPMVELAALSDLEKAHGVATLNPPVPGAWKWLGTDTIQFQAEGKFPYSTDYTVSVPQGVKSQLGGVLDKAFSFTFSTPTLKLMGHYPRQPYLQTLEPKILLQFDQRINKETLIKFIQLHAPGRAPEKMELLDPTLLEQDEAAKYIMSQKDKWIALKPIKTLQKNTQYQVVVEVGAISAEGPRKTTQTLIWNFSTYGEFGIERHYPTWEHPPGPWTLTFNNPIDFTTVKKELITIKPDVEFLLEQQPAANSLQIDSKALSKTTYKVTVSDELKDIHGQKLGYKNKVTITTGEAYPELTGHTGMLILEPASHKSYKFHTLGLHEILVSIYQVTPADYNQYLTLHKLPNPVHTTSLTTTSLTEYLTHEVDLEPYLQHQAEKLGQIYIELKPSKKDIEAQRNHWQSWHPTVTCWIQATNIALDIYTWSIGAGTQSLCWVSNLSDGSPVKGANVSVASSPKHSALTDDRGIAILSNYPSPPKSSESVLTASLGNDVCYNTDSAYAHSLGGTTFHTITDRGLYKPGETVSIKGYVRVLELLGDALVPKYATGKVQWVIHDAKYIEIQKGTEALNAYGTFTFKVQLPTSINLGNCSVSFTIPGSSGHLTFNVQEFRRPEFEVSSSLSPVTPQVISKEGSIVFSTAQASYFSGGPLTDAQVNWKVSYSPTTYTPPGWSGFTFGVHKPWWFWWGRRGRGRHHGGGEETGPKGSVTAEAVTDLEGKSQVEIAYRGAIDAPISVQANATVVDINKIAQQTSTSFVIHPTSLYVGFSSDHYYAKPKQPVPFQVIVVDADGAPVPRVSVQVESTLKTREPKQNASGVTTFEKKRTTTKHDVTSGERPVQFDFLAETGGEYELAFIVTDPKGHSFKSLMDISVVGGESHSHRDDTETVQAQEVTLVPNKQEYNPAVDKEGEVLVQVPFSPAHGLLTVEGKGVLFTKEFTVASTTTVLTFPIEESWIPSVSIRVNLVGATPRLKENGLPDTTKPGIPAYALGTQTIKLSRKSKMLNVDVKPKQTTARPGSTSEVDVVVTDSNGKPAPGCEVCVIAVDESVLALAGYSLTNPVEIFYPESSQVVQIINSRSHVTILRAEEHEKGGMEMEKKSRSRGMGGGAPKMMAIASCASAAPGGALNDLSFESASDGAAPSEPDIEVRSNFDPSAFFEASTITDGVGAIHVSFKLPDTLTRYRVWALAANDKLYGLGEGTVSTKLPLMIRPTPPRFLNFGDKANMTVVLQNQTDAAMTVKVAARAVNAALKSADFTGGYSVHVEANKRALVSLPLETVMAGTAKVQVVAATEGFSDAVNSEFPVYTPATSEAFASYGDVAETEAALVQPTKVPSAIYPEFGGLKISTSSTALQSLADAVLYLWAYPFECAEQMSSRVLGVLALKDVLTAFKVEDLPSAHSIMVKVSADVRRLIGLQRSDGGWGFWSGSPISFPYISAHVAFCLLSAKQKGIGFDNKVVTQAVAYLSSMESHIGLLGSKRSRLTLNAFGYAIACMLSPGHHKATNNAKDVLKKNKIEDLEIEALGWLLLALKSDASIKTTILKHLQNHVNVTAETAHFVTNYSAADDTEFVLLHSDTKVDAILLWALLEADPTNTLIPKIAKGLLAHKIKGRWSNTQENAYVLVALEKYFHVHENVEPNFVHQVFYGETFAGEMQFKGRTTETNEVSIPMNYLTAHPDQSITIVKNGPGRLYYRLAMTYAPHDTRMGPMEYGFRVVREYLPVDGADHVKRGADGSWIFKLGQKVKAKIVVYTPSRRCHVALVDPLPAGCEMLNPALKGTPSTEEPKSATTDWWCNPYYWFSHQNLRDDRAEAFSMQLGAGKYEYQYYTMASIKGTYVVPAAKAEQMYSPEVFGRSSSDVVIIA